MISFRKTVGIDLGTTNSVIAMLDATDSEIIVGKDEHGRALVPSIVGYRDEQPVVGQGAVAVAQAAAIRSIKRHMGLDRAFGLGADSLKPPQVAAKILAHLRGLLEKTLNERRFRIDSAIVTMPAYFNHDQIEATRQAGELAGFDVVELLHEPTAAAIYYSWAYSHLDGFYLVYDLGGGTFDVSIIRKRLDDFEVISVSGDPFLGGDDFDRLLASRLGEKALQSLLELHTPLGSANFQRLVRAAENIKKELSDQERVARTLPDVLEDETGRMQSLDVDIDRATFHQLIKDKMDRTVECCHEALGRAKEKIGLTLDHIDYVVLVGGSSRIPLVRDTVRAAFCNRNLPLSVRYAEPLIQEPDLCVAYGAALRAASYGTRYLFESADGKHVELHVTSAVNTTEPRYLLTAVVRGRDAADLCDGGSLRVCSVATGLVEEAFLDAKGSVAHEVQLAAETDNVLNLTLCDGVGREVASVPVTLRHTQKARQLGQGVLPTQLITKPLQVEVLNRQRQRVKQVIAPIGAPLPATFHCTLHTVDQAGRILVPILEENRVIKQMVIADLDPTMRVGTPVDVEVSIDVKHKITVEVVVRHSGRKETATIEAPPPPRRPTRAEVDEVRKQIDNLLGDFSGSYRSRVKTQVDRITQDLHEALRFDDEPKAIQRMAELSDWLQQLQTARTQVLDPPWARLGQLVKHCLVLAGEVAQATGRPREELFEQVYAQERYAEKAFEERNQTLYRECYENLSKLAGYLEQLKRDHLNVPLSASTRPPTVDDVKTDIRQLQSFLAELRKKARSRARADLEPRLAALERQTQTLAGQTHADVFASLREIHRLDTEAVKVQQALDGYAALAADEREGLLEGNV
jgi:molecular chaperone DnaK